MFIQSAIGKPKKYVFYKMKPRSAVVFVGYVGKHTNNIRECIGLKKPPEIFKASMGKNLMDDVVLISFDIQSVSVYRPQHMLEVFRRMGHIARVYPFP